MGGTQRTLCADIGMQCAARGDQIEIEDLVGKVIAGVMHGLDFPLSRVSLIETTHECYHIIRHECSIGVLMTYKEKNRLA